MTNKHRSAKIRRKKKRKTTKIRIGRDGIVRGGGHERCRRGVEGAIRRGGG